MGWLNANDAFLAMDRNENGLIDDVSELFGGMQRGQGFAKLALMDKNVDGFLTMEDGELAKLVAWKDANSDGVTDAGELIELSEIGIRKIDLKYESKNSLANQEHGNYAGEVSTATTSSGSIIIADMYFQYLPAADTIKNQFIAEHGNIL